MADEGDRSLIVGGEYTEKINFCKLSVLLKENIAEALEYIFYRKVKEKYRNTDSQTISNVVASEKWCLSSFGKMQKDLFQTKSIKQWDTTLFCRVLQFSSECFFVDGPKFCCTIRKGSKTIEKSSTIGGLKNDMHILLGLDNAAHYCIVKSVSKDSFQINKLLHISENKVTANVYYCQDAWLYVAELSYLRNDFGHSRHARVSESDFKHTIGKIENAYKNLDVPGDIIKKMKEIQTNEHILRDALFRGQNKMYDEVMKKLEEIYKNDEVTELVKSLCTADESNSTVFSERNALENIKTIIDVFFNLRIVCKMHDYELLKAFVVISANQEAITTLDNFTKELENSVLCELNLVGLNREDFKDFATNENSKKLTIKYESISFTLHKENLIRCILCKVFKLPRNSIQFVHFTEGCILVIYKISLKVKKCLLQYPLNPDIITSLSDCKIICLIIDDEMELKVSSYFNKMSTNISWTKITTDTHDIDSPGKAEKIESDTTELSDIPCSEEEIVPTEETIPTKETVPTEESAPKQPTETTDSKQDEEEMKENNSDTMKAPVESEAEPGSKEETVSTEETGPKNATEEISFKQDEEEMEEDNSTVKAPVECEAERFEPGDISDGSSELTMLQENYTMLCSVMTDVDNLLQYFVVENIITTDEENKIKNSRSNQVESLLLYIKGHIQAGDTNGFHIMLRIMKMHGTIATQKLAKLMESSLTHQVKNQTERDLLVEQLEEESSDSIKKQPNSEEPKEVEPEEVQRVMPGSDSTKEQSSSEIKETEPVQVSEPTENKTGPSDATINKSNTETIEVEAVQVSEDKMGSCDKSSGSSVKQQNYKSTEVTPVAESEPMGTQKNTAKVFPNYNPLPSNDKMKKT